MTEERPVEVFMDFTDMSNRPTTVYAIRVTGQDNQNKPYARTRLFVRRATMVSVLERVKEYAPPGVKIETYEGTIKWDDQIKPKKKRAKKEQGKLLDPPYEDAKLVPSTVAEEALSRLADGDLRLPTDAESLSWLRLPAGQNPEPPNPSWGPADGSSGPG